MKISIDEAVKVATACKQTGEMTGASAARIAAIRKGTNAKVLQHRNLAKRFSDSQTRLKQTEALLLKIGSVMENGANAYRETDLRLQALGRKSFLEQTATESASVEGVLLGQDSVNFKEGKVGGIIPAVGATFSAKTTDKDERSWFAKFFNIDLNGSASLLSEERTGERELWGISAAGTVSGAILTGELGIESKASWKLKDEDGNWDFKSFGISTVAKASFAVAKGEAEGNFGYLHGKISGKAITGAVTGEAKFALYDDGEFKPALSIGAKAEGSVLRGEAEGGVGTDQYGAYAKASGDLLHGEAAAEMGVGSLGKDKDGKTIYGATAKASAMASAAQGEVKGGITIFGIDIDVGVKGYAAAVGVETGGSITTKGVTAKFSGALALGAGLDISVDWSDAEWIGDSVEAVGDFIGEATEFAGDAIECVGDAAEDFFAGAADVAKGVGDSLFGWIR